MSDLQQLIDALSPETGVHIGGEWQKGELGTYDVDDPADRAILASVANAGSVQATTAVDAAAKVAAEWAATSPRRRSELLHRVFELMHRDAADLAALIVAENGKSTADARAEVAYAAEFFRWFAEEAVRGAGTVATAPSGANRIIVVRQPVGIAVMVTAVEALTGVARQTLTDLRVTLRGAGP